jgi:hypothetical protein
MLDGGKVGGITSNLSTAARFSTNGETVERMGTGGRADVTLDVEYDGREVNALRPLISLPIVRRGVIYERRE